MKKLFLGLIILYQRTLSPDHGWFKKFNPHGYCRFHPTCSQYTYTAINRFGIMKGAYLGSKRILRCNPWNKGGVDEVPTK